MCNQRPQPRYTLQEAAGEIGIGSRQLFRELRRRSVLDRYNVPTWRYKALGYFVEQRSSYQHPVVGPRFYSRALVTARGLAWLHELLPSSSEVPA